MKELWSSNFESHYYFKMMFCEIFTLPKKLSRRRLNWRSSRASYTSWIRTLERKKGF